MSHATSKYRYARRFRTAGERRRGMVIPKEIREKIEQKLKLDEEIEDWISDT